MTTDHSDVVEAATRWVAPRITEWSPGWRENLEAWLEPSLALVGGAEWGRQFRDMVQLPVSDPLAWANRRIDLPSGEWAIAGIRFRGRDVTKPFVDIIATSVSPTPDGIAALAATVPEFDDFSPLCMRVNLPEPSDGLRALAERSADTGHATPDLLIVARPIHEMLELPAASRYDDVALVRCAPDEAAGRVAAIYAELTPSRPNLDKWATPAAADELEDASRAGLLFDIRVDGESAGILAAERDDAYGFTGFCMQEIVLDSAHRGQGIGVAALQRLCREVPAGRRDVLWGHIHPDNIPSLRNAHEAGREAVTAHVWVTPPGYPGMPS